MLFAFVLLLTSTVLNGCLTAQLPRRKEGCKIRTYVNAGLLDYVNSRYDSEQMPRMAVFPFSVPETFAPTGHESLDYGRQLASLFHRELLDTGEIRIVELFNRDSWPGKRAEFNTGNYTAIQMARNAGYDLLLVGYMDEITNETDLPVFTKVIDTSNAATVWYGKTVAYSSKRQWERSLSKLPLSPVEEHPDRFYFPERAERLAACTVERLVHGEPDLSPRSVLESNRAHVGAERGDGDSTVQEPLEERAAPTQLPPRQPPR